MDNNLKYFIRDEILNLRTSLYNGAISYNAYRVFIEDFANRYNMKCILKLEILEGVKFYKHVLTQNGEEILIIPVDEKVVDLYAEEGYNKNN